MCRRRPCDDDVGGASRAHWASLQAALVTLLKGGFSGVVLVVDVGCGSTCATSSWLFSYDVPLCHHVVVDAQDVRRSSLRARVSSMAPAGICCIVTLCGNVVLPWLASNVLISNGPLRMC